MRVVLADDEIYGLKRLKNACLAIDFVDVVGEAQSGTELLSLIEQHKPDCVVTDIEMPGISGVEVVLQIPHPRPEVIFVTAHDQFAVAAFELDVAHYLMKPIMADRLREALTRAARRRSNPGGEPPPSAEASDADASPSDIGIWVPTKNGSVRVPAETIDWVEAAGDYALIHTPYRSHILRTTMGTLETQLASAGIKRVHRCALIKTSNIVEILRTGRSYSVALKDGALIQVGGSYVENLKSYLGIS